MAVIDSSAMIEILNGTPKGQTIAKKYGGVITATTAFSVHEVLAGYSKNNRKIANDFIDTLEILSYDKKASKQSLQIETTH